MNCASPTTSANSSNPSGPDIITLSPNPARPIALSTPRVSRVPLCTTTIRHPGNSPATLPNAPTAVSTPCHPCSPPKYTKISTPYISPTSKNVSSAAFGITVILPASTPIPRSAPAVTPDTHRISAAPRRHFLSISPTFARSAWLSKYPGHAYSNSHPGSAFTSNTHGQSSTASNTAHPPHGSRNTAISNSSRTRPACPATNCANPVARPNKSRPPPTYRKISIPPSR